MCVLHHNILFVFDCIPTLNLRVHCEPFCRLLLTSFYLAVRSIVVRLCEPVIVRRFHERLFDQVRLGN